MDVRRLKGKMALIGLTQAELAERLGTSVSSFNAKLNGRRSFRLSEAEKICEVLGISDPTERAEIFLSLDVQM